MKENPGISASPSLPFPVRGESQGYDSDPETSSKRHRNGTQQHGTVTHRHKSVRLIGVYPCVFVGGARPLDKRLTM